MQHTYTQTQMQTHNDAHAPALHKSIKRVSSIVHGYILNNLADHRQVSTGRLRSRCERGRRFCSTATRSTTRQVPPALALGTAKAACAWMWHAWMAVPAGLVLRKDCLQQIQGCCDECVAMPLQLGAPPALSSSA